MKLCYRCKTSKPISEFHRSAVKKDGLQPDCKVCNRERVKLDYRLNNRKQAYAKRAVQQRLECKKIVDYIKAYCGCAHCTESDACCFDFHHLGNKDESISIIMVSKNRPKLLREIKKCMVLCSNCHRKVHGKKLAITDAEIQSSQNSIKECLLSNPQWGKRKRRSDAKTL